MYVLAIALFLGSCLGHIAVLSFSNNWWFSRALPHRLLTGVRLLHGALVVAGVAAFVRAYPLDFSLAEAVSSGNPARIAATGYTVLCASVGIVLLPFITVIRRLKATPAILLSNDTQMRNIASDLGYKPVGKGKYRALARLPGNQVFQVDFTVRTLRLPRLPAAWDGLSILHLSDLHLCGTPDKIFYQRVMDLCQEWEPDLVAFTGDTVDTTNHYRWILPVLGKLRWRVAGLAILGNHDSWHEPAALRRRLRRCGYHVLNNSWKQLDVRGEPLIAIGHEGPWFVPAADLSTCPEGAFRLCLSHTPDNIRWARRQQVDLMLSGHNHGGQIRFPLIGSVLVPSSYGRRYDCGIFWEAPTALHVSRGLGGQHPLRFNCRPEVSKLVLRVPEEKA
jgi:predicted MPP superfamily phosphohydrolase